MMKCCDDITLLNDLKTLYVMLFVNGDALCDELVKVDVTMMTRQAMTLHVIRLSMTTLCAVFVFLYK